MSNCIGDKALVIGRPTQTRYETLSHSTGGCGTQACNAPVAPHDRRLSPRRNREKVREDIRDYVLLMLGAPVVKVELDQQQLDLAVDQSLKVFEEYAGREYFDYYTFYTTPGKSVYKMPDDVGVIRNVFYMVQGANFAFNASDLGGAVPLEYIYPGSGSTFAGGAGFLNPTAPVWGNMGEWTLFKQYENMYARTSS